EKAARSVLRHRALAWFRAELAAYQKLCDSGQATDRQAVWNAARQWQSHPDLSGVRHPWSLLRLSADERRQWQTFWTDVDELVKRAGKAGMACRRRGGPPAPRIAPDKVKPLHGPYHCPRLRRGDRAHGHSRDQWMTVTGTSGGRIAGPLCRPARGKGRPGLL